MLIGLGACALSTNCMIPIGTGLLGIGINESYTKTLLNMLNNLLLLKFALELGLLSNYIFIGEESVSEPKFVIDKERIAMVIVEVCMFLITFKQNKHLKNKTSTGYDEVQIAAEILA